MKDRLSTCGIRDDSRAAAHECAQPDLPVLRAEVEISGVSVLDWFSRQASGERFYWASRDGREEVAGFGTTIRIDETQHTTASEALTAIRNALDRGPAGLRYYGGMCFDPHDERPSMKGFGRFAFFIPAVELRRCGPRTTLAATQVADAGPFETQLQTLADDALRASGGEAQNRTVGRVLSRTDTPRRDQWTTMVEQTRATMQRQSIGKIVLSRKSELTMSQPLEAGALLARLQKSGDGSYNFCFEFGRRSFAGSSPECLYRRSGRDIYTEALAGTCGVGKTRKETEALRTELLDSAKEADEHRYVFDGILSKLEHICSRHHVLSEREVLKLSHVQHFVSRFEGHLKDGVDTAQIIEALHPTAAVGGYPQQAAVEQIRQIEHHARQWYAGPVGWLGQDADEFTVGIRSCVIDAATLTLYAGAGIVKASDAASEWAETEAKMQHFIEALA